MTSGCHYHIDLNEDQNHQPLIFSTLPSQPSSSSSLSLSYLPFFNPAQEHGGYLHGDHSQLFQPQAEVKTHVSTGGPCDHRTHRKETRIKLTIRKKEERSNIDQKQISSLATDHADQSINSHACSYNNNNNNNGMIRVCSDCNTTKTPLWRSGPRGPKSLCNACGIRQRKARRAAMAAAVAAAAAGGGGGTADDAPPPPPPQTIKKKNKNKRAKNHSVCFAPGIEKKSKITSTSVSQNKSSSSSKLCLDDLTIILSKSSAFQQVFPQDEKEAAILLMALSYGMVHG